MQELVSIITPTYNCSKFIEQTIESVLNQSYSNWEMIIVDDCSDDDTVKIAKRYSKEDQRIKVFYNKTNKGPALTRNKAIKIASGRFIAFLDGDDTWRPEKLKKQLKFQIKNKYAFTYTSFGRIDEEGQKIGKTNAPSELTYDDLIKTCPIGCLTVIYDTLYFDKQFMPIIDKRQDYALWLKLLRKVDKAYGLNEVLADYRIHSNSISSNKLHAAKYQWLVYRKKENLPFHKALYAFSFYTFHGFIRKYL